MVLRIAFVGPRAAYLVRRRGKSYISRWCDSLFIETWNWLMCRIIGHEMCDIPECCSIPRCIWCGAQLEG